MAFELLWQSGFDISFEIKKSTLILRVDFLFFV